jgi:hypothetical protein
MNCWESFYIYILQKQNILIDEQVNHLNTLYELARGVALHNYRPIPTFSLLLTSSPHRPNQGKSIISINIIYHFNYNFLLHLTLVIAYLNYIRSHIYQQLDFNMT